ncbi:uncharacterized protein [Palaemon carinicauda]|uniref:uncharacterized protein n=1 Tax=Palaemon carinicauda TaxID=392227 RepID=UPI0035B69E77
MIKDRTENAILEVQGGIRRGRRCINHILTVKQICEKYSAKRKDVYVAFTVLEKAYGRVNREAMWTVMRLYGIGGRLLQAGCNALHITDLDVPKVIQNGSRSSVILDCIYSYEPHDQGSLVVKWFWNHEPEAVYQWIPGKKPEAIGILRGRLNLEYSASKDKYSQHRALEILYPTTELTGFYTCSVSSFHDEEFESKRMIVYAPATSMNVSYHKTTPSTVNVTCDAHGMYPKPLLRLYEGATKQSRSLVKEAHEEVIEAEDGFSVYLQAQMEDRVLKQQETIFECVLSIPETEYQVRRNIIYFPGYDAFEAVGSVAKEVSDTTFLLFLLSLLYLH